MSYCQHWLESMPFSWPDLREQQRKIIRCMWTYVSHLQQQQVHLLDAFAGGATIWLLPACSQALLLGDSSFWGHETMHRPLFLLASHPSAMTLFLHQLLTCLMRKSAGDRCDVEARRQQCRSGARESLAALRSNFLSQAAI